MALPVRVSATVDSLDDHLLKRTCIRSPSLVSVVMLSGNLSVTPISVTRDSEGESLSRAMVQTRCREPLFARCSATHGGTHREQSGAHERDAAGLGHGGRWGRAHKRCLGDSKISLTT